MLSSPHLFCGQNKKRQAAFWQHAACTSFMTMKPEARHKKAGLGKIPPLGRIWVNIKSQ